MRVVTVIKDFQPLKGFTVRTVDYNPNIHIKIKITPSHHHTNPITNKMHSYNPNPHFTYLGVCKNTYQVRVVRPICEN